MGVYPAVPQGIEIPAFIDPEDGRERMDNSGGLFELAWDGGSQTDAVILRRVDGTSEVVYTESSEPEVSIHLSSLLTGP
jgi:hypothetical protein